MQEQARQLLTSSEEASIARSADVIQQQESWANETQQQQQTRRTADANCHQESQANESTKLQNS